MALITSAVAGLATTMRLAHLWAALTKPLYHLVKVFIA